MSPKKMVQYPSTVVFDLPISQMNMQETVDYLKGVIERRNTHHVITANPIMLMEGVHNPTFQEVLKSAELLVPDGTGLVWAAGVLGKGVKERVAGYDLMHELLKKGENYGWRVFLLGASPEVISLASERLAKQYPGIQWVGARDGYFKEEDDEAVISEITRAKPDLLFVARGLDTQEPWIAKHKAKLNIPVMMGIGGSLDVVAGKMKRAPVLFQKLHLEWFHRLLQDPSRLGRMMALPRFVVEVQKRKRSLK